MPTPCCAGWSPITPSHRRSRRTRTCDVLSLEFEPTPYALFSVLTLCDMAASPDGELVPVEQMTDTSAFAVFLLYIVRSSFDQAGQIEATSVQCAANLPFVQGCPDLMLLICSQPDCSSR